MDELVEQHLDALGVVAEHARDRGVPVARAVVSAPSTYSAWSKPRSESIDEVDDVGGAVGRRAASEQEHAVVLVAVFDERAQSAPSFS